MMGEGLALVRRPGPRLAEGIVTNIERSPIDLQLADRQWAAYVSALEAAGWDLLEVPPAADCPDAVFVDVGMNPFQSIIHLLSDPNIAFILLTLGFYGLLFELQSPNFVTGILGAIALVLAFIGFGSLPLNVAGLILIGLAVVLFILETTVTSHGLLAVGGLVCFVLGAFTLYTAPGTPAAPDVSVAMPLVVVMTVITGLYVGVVLLTVARGRRRSLAFAGAYGAGGTMTVPNGTVGVARTSLEPIGVVYAAGEEWTARASGDVAIQSGQPVRVVGQEDLTLVVESGPAASPEGA